MAKLHGTALALFAALGACAAGPRVAHAQTAVDSPPAPTDRAPESRAPSVAAPSEPAATPEPTQAEVVPSKAPERQTSLDPQRTEEAPKGRTTFDIDPFVDSAMIAVSLGFYGTLETINSTGEIRPQQIDPNFDTNNLIGIDRGAVTQTPDPSARSRSTIGLGIAAAYAVLDPILSGVREHNVQTGLADFFMYAESVSFTLAMTSLVKMAVRRPRPIAYIEANAHKNDEVPYSNSSTDSALSFFSGHAAVTATISSTATYLAFVRSPRTVRPWLTLAAGVGLTTFVSFERVRAGAHFPTDVIAGAIAGAGIGVVVPHLHRTDEIKQRRIWVGFTPLRSLESERGGLLNVSGIF
jgi:membrane-associated phospholipid phosphatase